MTVDSVDWCHRDTAREALIVAECVKVTPILLEEWCFPPTDRGLSPENNIPRLRTFETFHFIFKVALFIMNL